MSEKTEQLFQALKAAVVASQDMEAAKAFDNFALSYNADNKQPLEVWVLYKGTYPIGLSYYTTQELAKEKAITRAQYGLKVDPVGKDGFRITMEEAEYGVTKVGVSTE